MERESFKSRLGFILVSAGCAIGIGNVWKFPFVTGMNGGGVFVLFYLIFLIIMGVPVLTMELAIGRASRQSAVEGYKVLEPEGSKWHIHGWFCIGGCYLLMMFYTPVSGWMLDYFMKFVTGSFEGVSPDEVEGIFGNMLADTGELVLYMSVMVIAGIIVCSIGIQKGLEKVSKFMMICLLMLLLVLAFHSMTLSGAGEGLKFYLLPNFSRAAELGIWNVATAAMSQAFFTLSLGLASMEIFGSYMTRDFSLAGEAVRICILDTLVAIISGLIIFPACFSYGVETSAGPPLIFITLPQVFIHMAGGRIWGTIFFLFMTFASFSTVIAVFENLIAAAIDNFGWDRRKSSVFNLLFMLAACLPCVFGFNIWSGLHLIGARDVLESEDFIVSNLLLPIGAITYVMFCTTRWGWGFDKYLEECNAGKGVKFRRWMKPYFMYILPLLVLVIFIQGLLGN